MLLVWTFYSSKILKNHGFLQKYLAVNAKYNRFAEQQIIILEWFLKDHVTLNTGVLMLKILILPSQE